MREDGGSAEEGMDKGHGCAAGHFSFARGHPFVGPLPPLSPFSHAEGAPDSIRSVKYS